MRPGILHGKHVPVLGVHDDSCGTQGLLLDVMSATRDNLLFLFLAQSGKLASSQHEAFGSHKAFRRFGCMTCMIPLRSTHDNLYMKKVYHIVSPLMKASLNRVFKM